jgi:hypothetical protein
MQTTLNAIFFPTTLARTLATVGATVACKQLVTLLFMLAPLMTNRKSHKTAVQSEES